MLSTPLLFLFFGLLTLGGLFLFNWALSRFFERLAPPLGRFVEIDGLRLHIVDSGEKPGQSGAPLLFVHGLLGQLNHFAMALAALFPERRVVLFDRPGSGFSQPAPSQTLAAQAEITARLIARLKLDRPLVVGHSLGGAVALALALDHPDRVGGLALVAPLTYPLSPPPKPFAALAWGVRPARWLGAWTLGPLISLWRAATALKQVFAPEPPAKDFWIRGGGMLAARPTALLAAARDIERQPEELPKMAARYGGLVGPVGVLFGAQDPVLDAQTQGADFCAQAPRAELTLIDGGHMLPVTQPLATESFIRKVLTQVDRRSPPPGIDGERISGARGSVGGGRESSCRNDSPSVRVSFDPPARDDFTPRTGKNWWRMLAARMNDFGGSVLSIFKERKKIAGLDGLRALCITMVIVHHSAILGGDDIDLGGLGVYIFFCISGFLIVPVLFKQAQKAETAASCRSNELMKFFFNRSIRIFPVYYFVLIFFVAPMFVLSYYKSGEFCAVHCRIIPYLFTYTTNVYVGQIVNAWPGIVSHFWSLAVEQQFYLLFPILFILIPSRYWLPLLIILSLVLALGSFTLYNSKIEFYAGTMTGVFAITTGGIAALAPLNVSRRLKAEAIFVGTSLLFLTLVYYGYYKYAIIFGSIFFAIFLKALTSQADGFFVRCLESPLLRGIGVISYGFYIYHAFMLVAAAVIVKRAFGIAAAFPEEDLGFGFRALVLALGYALTLLVASFSYVLLEKPILRLKEKAARSRAGWEPAAGAQRAELTPGESGP